MTIVGADCISLNVEYCERKHGIDDGWRTGSVGWWFLSNPMCITLHWFPSCAKMRKRLHSGIVGVGSYRQMVCVKNNDCYMNISFTYRNV